MPSVAGQGPGEPRGPERASRAIPWAVVGSVAALIILMDLPVILRMMNQWRTDDDMGHGFFVPLVAGYIVWLRRDELIATAVKPNYWGLAVIAWGCFQLLLGTVGAELFLQRSSIIITIAGCVLLGCGAAMLKRLAFPIFLLLFMLPLPRILYTQITFPLQLLASRVAETTLSLLGIPVLREGNVLELASQKLSVVEACSGIRSLLTLSFLALVYGFFFDRKTWMRWVLLVVTIPIAILANSGRVTMTGLLSEFRPDLARGLFHSFEGWVIFLVALLMLVATHCTINFAYHHLHGKQPTRTA